MTYCWDCELPALSALCASCTEHREMCGVPKYYNEEVHGIDGDLRGVVYRDAHDRDWLKVGARFYRYGEVGWPESPRERRLAWYCHGAGPDGTDVDRLTHLPRPLSDKDIYHHKRPKAGAK